MPLEPRRETPPRNWGELLRAMGRELAGYWSGAERYQKFLYAVGALLIASSLFHLGVLVVSGGSWHGPVSWRKPILFGEAFGLTAISIAWIMTFLPKNRFLGWPVAAALGLTNAVEVCWVSMQQWRGVASHFNLSTSFDENAFALGGGVAIAFTSASIALITVWSFFSLRAPASYKLAIRAGLLLLLAALVLGQLMISHGIAQVQDESGSFVPEALDRAVVFGAAGVMKLPHAIALHGAQILPALAFVLGFCSWKERRRGGVVLVATAGYAGLLGFVALQAFSGRAPLDPTRAAISLLIASGLLLAAAAQLAVAGLNRTLRLRA